MENASPISVHRFVIDFSVYYSVLPPAPEHDRGITLVVLHGFGQRCDRFIAQFRPLAEAGITVVAPQAPNAFYVKFETRTVGFTWLTRYERDQAIRDVVAYLDRLLDTLHARENMPLQPLYFLGFSQGVSMAYRYAVHGKHGVTGVIACGADLPPDVAERLPNARPFRVLLVHGRDDTVVPVSKCEAAEQVLRRHHVPLDRFIFSGGHHIPPEVLPKILDWMQPPASR